MAGFDGRWWLSAGPLISILSRWRPLRNPAPPSFPRKRNPSPPVGAPKVQILTIGELLEGKQSEIPTHPSMYQAAQRVRPAEGRQAGFGEAV